MSFSFAVTPEAIRPNDAPAMELNEKRTFTFKLVGSLGSATISANTVTGDNLTIGSVTRSGVTMTVPITATSVGCFALKLTVTLSDGSIIVRVVRVKVVDSTRDTGSSDYE